MNLWSSFRGQPPQRRARLYRALVDRRLASSIAGQIVPTAQPFLYTLSATATEATPLSSVESVLLEEIEAVRLHGVTAAELARAKKQLQARFVFDNDSITNIAHQLGFFETVATVDMFGELSQRVDGVTLESVAEIAARMFHASNRTIGWFDPIGIAPAAPQAAAGR